MLDKLYMLLLCHQIGVTIYRLTTLSLLLWFLLPRRRRILAGFPNHTHGNPDEANRHRVKAEIKEPQGVRVALFFAILEIGKGQCATPAHAKQDRHKEDGIECSIKRFEGQTPQAIIGKFSSELDRMVV